ncbi:MAG TPA: GDP-mannose dehydrogenase [Solibacterales bacterium]|nr:GDP-mannose dehydrogenase [Bryobacterales bacterium]
MASGTFESVAVVGLGYVGCVTAACLARLGHRVVGVDRDPHKVEAVLAGRAPFFEPGLEPLVAESVKAGRLSAVTSLAEALASSSIALLCVGTPSERNGNLNLDQLRRVCAEIGADLAKNPRRLVVAVRSTVFPGVCEDVVAPEVAGAPVVSNPEFLREGAAVKDFMDPSLVVVGGSDPDAVGTVAGLYEPLGVAPCLVSLRTAEMIKYACNAFHAVKIAFANEVGSLAATAGIDPDEVLGTLCQDTRLNVSAAYLKPGFAFGGSCLPKDLRALAYRAARLDLRLPLLENVLASNEQHLRRAIDAVMDLPARRIGIFGLAFKEDTDDLRESPVVSLIEFLIGKGRDLLIFDAQIRLENIYGSNRGFILSAVPHIGKLMVPSVDELLASADHIVVAQKPSAAYAARLAASGAKVLDLTVLEPR